jgi:hypothetical protein
MKWSSRRTSTSASAAQAGGDGLVAAAGFGIAAGMVVADDHRRCVVGQRAPRDFARIDLRAIHRAAEQFLEGQRAVAGVEEQRGEDLLGGGAACGRNSRRPARCRHRLAAQLGGGEVAVAQFQRGGQQAGARRADAGEFASSCGGRSSRARSGPCAFSRSRAVATACGRACRSRGRSRAIRHRTARRRRARRVFRGVVRRGPVADCMVTASRAGDRTRIGGMEGFG